MFSTDDAIGLGEGRGWSPLKLLRTNLSKLLSRSRN